MPTLGDTLRAYIKPSLDGAIILRKRTTTQVSPRVKASQERVGSAKPSVSAHAACETAGKARPVRVYKPGVGYEEKKVCPIKTMKAFLRDSMKRAHGK
jgi:hypothetical protein